MYLWCKSTYFFCEKGHFEMGFVEKFFPQKKCKKKVKALLKKTKTFFKRGVAKFLRDVAKFSRYFCDFEKRKGTH